MVNNDDDLKLIYVLKIGYNTKGEGLYEFVFSEDETNVDVEDWLWELSPASEHAEPPNPDFVDRIFHLKTKAFNLVCLHESYDRPYVHGYHGIIALAYEDIDNEIESPDGFDPDDMFGEAEDDDDPVVVFHYGVTLTQVKDILYQKKIILKGNDFIGSSSVSLN
jgi:hypothetical protein